MNLSEKIIRFVDEHESDDIHAFALRSGQFPDIDMQFAIRQISGRQTTKDKIPTWYASKSIIYPKHISLEQSSSEQTARYKASLCDGLLMVDLTGGFGVDFSFLASGFKKAIYVEQQAELSEIAKHNFGKLSLGNTEVVNSDAIEYLSGMESVDLIYIDPARRDTKGRKTVLIEDCTPNILAIESLLDEKSEQTMIKLSPMLDISLAVKSMHTVSEIHIISVNNECKELLFIKCKEKCDIEYHCVNILNNRTDHFIFYKEQEEQCRISYASSPEEYLYEPNASILKAGAYKSIAENHSLKKLHPSSHLYTSSNLHNDFQGRVFKIEGVCPLNKKEIKGHVPDQQANVTTRNFPISVQEIRKKTGLKDGGNVYIFATTLYDGKKVMIICSKI